MIMVSVDPERDTPAKLKDYVAYFHPQMLGVVGTPAETAAVAKPSAPAMCASRTRPDGSYAVDHIPRRPMWSDRDGKLVDMLPLGTPPTRSWRRCASCYDAARPIAPSSCCWPASAAFAPASSMPRGCAPAAGRTMATHARWWRNCA
jgi:hypothetical protein